MTVSTRLRGGGTAFVALLLAAACSSGGTATPSPSSAAPATSAPAASSPAASSPAASSAAECVPGSITASGSTAMQPVVDAASKKYAQACPGSVVNVQGGGSGTGLSQVSQGAVQIGNSDVTAESRNPPITGLVDHIVLKQGWIMVVNTSVTGVKNLTTQQAQDIWTGKTTNWKVVGGPDSAIVLVLRPASSGTRATFKKIVLNGMDEAKGNVLTEDSNGAVTTAVSTTPGATSVIGFAYYAANQGKVTGLQLDGIDATVANLQNGTYKLQADGHMYTKGDATGLAKAFIDYMLSPAVQKDLIPTLYYAPVGS